MKHKSAIAGQLHRAKVDADRERLARRVVDKALKEAIDRLANIRAILKEAEELAQTESAWRDVWLPKLKKESGAVGV